MTTVATETNATAPVAPEVIAFLFADDTDVDSLRLRDAFMQTWPQ